MGLVLAVVQLGELVGQGNGRGLFLSLTRETTRLQVGDTRLGFIPQGRTPHKSAPSLITPTTLSLLIRYGVRRMYCLSSLFFLGRLYFT